MVVSVVAAFVATPLGVTQAARGQRARSAGKVTFLMSGGGGGPGCQASFRLDWGDDSMAATGFVRQAALPHTYAAGTWHASLTETFMKSSEECSYPGPGGALYSTMIKHLDFSCGTGSVPCNSIDGGATFTGLVKPAPSVKGQRPGGSGTGGPSTGFSPCSLVTKQEAAQILGVSASALMAETTTSPSRSCSYHNGLHETQPGFKSFGIAYSDMRNSAIGYKAVRTHRYAGCNNGPKVGDQTCWDHGKLVIFAKQQYVFLEPCFFECGSAPAPVKAKIDALAPRVVGRLP